MLVDKFWAEALSDVLRKGEERIDRTGVGTISRFGSISGSTSVNCGNQIPIITLKKVHFKSVLAELIWFIKGKTNVDFLHKYNCTIWNEWSDSNGNLGPIYGANWRNWGDKPKNIPQPVPKLRADIKPTFLRVGNGSGSYKHPLGKTWEGMMSRCYDKKNISYKTYGAIGVHVCDRWLEFKAFADDAVNLPGFNLKTDVRKVLDKDIIGNGFVYSPDKCHWVTDSQNASGNEKWIYTVKKAGIDYSFTNIGHFCSEHGIESKNFSDLWTGNKKAKSRHGFTFVSKKPIRTTIDQLANVIESIKNDPFGRRHIVSAWNPNDIDKMALPPCHMFFQFYVSKHGYLDIFFYMRSCDLFLGFPFNVTSYALLLMIVAKLTGYTAGNVHWHLGDAHIYKNHIDQVKIALGRTMVSPQNAQIVFADKVYNSIDDFEVEDIELINYQSHPVIKAPIAI